MNKWLLVANFLVQKKVFSNFFNVFLKVNFYTPSGFFYRFEIMSSCFPSIKTKLLDFKNSSTVYNNNLYKNIICGPWGFSQSLQHHMILNFN